MTTVPLTLDALSRQGLNMGRGSYGEAAVFGRFHNGSGQGMFTVHFYGRGHRQHFLLGRPVPGPAPPCKCLL